MIPSVSMRAARLAAFRASSRRPAQQARRWAGDMPVPQSQNAPLWRGHTVKEEGWETSMYVYAALAVVLQAAIIGFAPETSIESWARAEAKARLALKEKDPDMKFEFGTHYQDLIKQDQLDKWTKFSDRAITPGEDDDDDDEDEDDDDDEDEDEDDEE
ncbi:unnamed protein product [Cylindrotheca closterium]|uniref:NADH dehydrogenase [ubiquinone] 1 beta subcomplex subunit 11, mitochondrial n=1 Tax=Cylindrotheca closterium TaxID=2856 RepID=A0AAD2GD99_9STRA|nr:unnamed protein product [Cylindrotheca closterium]